MRRYTWGDGARTALARAAVFSPAAGVREVHLTVTPAAGDFAAQRAGVRDGYAAALSELGLGADSAVFRRLFASDLANQAAALATDEIVGAGTNAAPVALSLIEEPPLPGRRLALWAWHVDDGAGGPLPRERSGRAVRLPREGRTHLWTTRITNGSRTVHAQTEAVFAALESELTPLGARLADHTLRTWVYVRDIDRDYEEMVRARRALFAARGMTADTHYVASTGIEGRTDRAAELVLLDAYAVAGLDADQIRFLHAPDNLGRTSDYGVTFERGTAVTYGDRRHVIISGTASIDPAGNLLHRGDLGGQLGRTADNVAALLTDAGATPADLAHLIVYVRDPADEAEASAFVAERFEGVPHVLVHAPVCRPGWLVEIEGMAVVTASDDRWRPF